MSAVFGLSSTERKRCLAITNAPSRHNIADAINPPRMLVRLRGVGLVIIFCVPNVPVQPRLQLARGVRKHDT